MKQRTALKHYVYADRLSRFLRTAGRFSAVSVPVLLTAALAGCAASPSESLKEAPHTVSVFAASSLTDVLSELGESYESEHPEIDLVFTFDSSGTLKTQITEGAECDLFVSAAVSQLDALLASDPCPVLTGTETELLTNTLVLAVSPGYEGQVAGFSDLTPDNLTLLAIGNEDVPAGAYAKELLCGLSLYQELLDASRLSFASSVREVTLQVADEAVDCGIIFATDAAAEGLIVLEAADSSLCSPIVYPAAVITTGSDADAAGNFLDWLSGEDAREAFLAAGFGVN